MKISFWKMIKPLLPLTLIGTLLFLTSCGNTQQTGSNSTSGSQTKTDIRIGTVTWIGYAGLWLAKDLGYFDEAGLNVNYSTIEDTTQIKNSLAADQLDGMATTIDSIPRDVSEGINAKTVLALDQSRGADGIVVKNDVKQVSDLKGKEVAVEDGSVSEWFLANVLAKSSLTVNDIKVKEMTASDAGAAFSSGKVEAAVTWEPWLSNAQKTSFGKVLVSSKQYPNIIVDVFTFSDKFTSAHPEAVKAFIKAYERGVQYLKDHPDASYKILAKRIDGTPEDVKAQLNGLHIMSVADSKVFFGTQSNPGAGYQLAQTAADFWYKKGVMKQKADPTKVKNSIDPSYLSN